MRFIPTVQGSLLSIAALSALSACSDGKKFAAGVPNAAAPTSENVDVQTPASNPTKVSTEVVTVPSTKPTATANFNECDKFSDANIVADLYQTSEGDFHGKYGQKPLTNFVYGKPEKTFCMSNLDIPMRPFSEGFPSYPNLQSWFILDTRFTLNVPADGTYTILLDSDDGSIVSVNGVQLIAVDGLRDGNLKIVEKKTVDLKKGAAAFRVQYFQGPGPDLAIQLKWQKPGDSSPEVIPLKYISLPK
jgi:hypothetical protein